MTVWRWSISRILARLLARHQVNLRSLLMERLTAHCMCLRFREVTTHSSRERWHREHQSCRIYIPLEVLKAWVLRKKYVPFFHYNFPSPHFSRLLNLINSLLPLLLSSKHMLPVDTNPQNSLRPYFVMSSCENPMTLPPVDATTR